MARGGEPLAIRPAFSACNGSDAAGIPRLQSYATIYSGRRGVAVQFGPIAALEVLTGSTGGACAAAVSCETQSEEFCGEVGRSVHWIFTFG